MFHKASLANGLRIITLPQKSTRAVTVLVLVKTGSHYETKEVNGISHFLEHMFFKGTQERPAQMAIAETLDRVGGIYNAFTSEEFTGYFAKVEASFFNLALDLISDIYLNSKLESQEIRKEKGVVLEEINMHFDNPMSYIGILWNKVLYGDQPAGRDIAGTKESVASLDRRKLVQYLRSQYVAPNTVVCAAGNVASDWAVSQIKKSFAGINHRTPVSKSRVKESQANPQCLLHPRKTDQTHLALGVRGYNLFHPHRYALDILGVILGGMMSSRLFNEIRTKMGAAYYISTETSSSTDTGYLVTSAGVDHQKIDLVISAILRAYREMAARRVPKLELQKAKDCVKGRMSLLLESSDSRASFFALQELLEGKILTLEQIFEIIDKIQAEDILTVAQDIFKPQKLNLALIGPFEDQGRFAKILKFK